jgi:SAM-dependent MidA family methyltransferase
MPISTFMEMCLRDPQDGYYASRPRLGVEGDFITAPHVSQMFGELIGVWAAETWASMGRPPRLRLVELGPGDGTMITDVLRAARAAPDFLAACELWLVEMSAPLRAAQTTALAKASMSAQWAHDWRSLPGDPPLIVIANEFLDCFPIRQYLRGEDGWLERRVAVDGAGALVFQAVPPSRHPTSCPDLDAAPAGSVLETSSALADFGAAIGALVSRAGGAALFIDYGAERPGLGDTLQAIRGHAREPALDNPGEADLTAHVDFPAFLRAARDAGAATSPIRTQGDFLRDLGIEARAGALARSHPGRAGEIGRQLERLIGAQGMGALFKVACVHSAGLAPPGLTPRR